MSDASSTRHALHVMHEPFGTTPDGDPITIYRVTDGRGLTLELLDWGATIRAVHAPDREGQSANVTLSFPSLDGYLTRHPYFGSTVGRYANRIAGGRFTLDGETVALATNNGPNHLHGGVKGFDAVRWQAEPIASQAEAGVRFSYISADGEEGYPGALTVTNFTTLTADGAIRIVYEATTDRPTVLNLCNHAYWNLAGTDGGPDQTPTIADHLLTLAAEAYLPVDEQSIPTAEVRAVTGTPFDFRTRKPIGRDLAQVTGERTGYDHCFVLAMESSLAVRPVATVTDPSSGRTMTVTSTQPGVQLYTGNFLDGSRSCGGFRQHQAFCLETQHFPDSPNQPTFPSTVLRPGQLYRQETVHRFSVE